MAIKHLCFRAISLTVLGRMLSRREGSGKCPQRLWKCAWPLWKVMRDYKEKLQRDCSPIARTWCLFGYWRWRSQDGASHQNNGGGDLDAIKKSTSIAPSFEGGHPKSNNSMWWCKCSTSEDLVSHCHTALCIWQAQCAGGHNFGCVAGGAFVIKSPPLGNPYSTLFDPLVPQSQPVRK